MATNKRPLVLSKDELKSFFRFENLKGYRYGLYDGCKLNFTDPLGVTLQDFKEAIKNIEKSGLSKAQILDRWYRWFGTDWYDLSTGLFESDLLFVQENDEKIIRGIDTENDVFFNTMDALESYCYEEEIEYSLKDLIKDIDMALARKGKSPLDWPLDDIDKTRYLSHWDYENRISEANDVELTLFKRYAEELYKKKNNTAMRVIAYGCYGGNAAFECDWKRSEEALLKIIKSGDDDAFIANTLGYIYYYGRTTDGKPNYAKAFKYFTIGAAGGVYESRYKLADMFAHGYFVDKNVTLASKIIDEMYDENLPYIARGAFDCKFGDIALRMKDFSPAGRGDDIKNEWKYYYLLQAEYAIRMRMQTLDYIGDRKVYAGIKKSIEAVRPNLTYKDDAKVIKYDYISIIIHFGLLNNHRMQIDVKSLAGGNYLLTFTALQRGDEKYCPKIFTIVPEFGFCGLKDSITVKFKPDNFCDSLKDGDGIVFDEVCSNEFSLYGKTVLNLSGSYILQRKDFEDKKKYRMASVCFGGEYCYYDYICNDESIKAGDKVIVNTIYTGNCEVTVVAINMKTESELPLPIKTYKKVVRKVL